MEVWAVKRLKYAAGFNNVWMARFGFIFTATHTVLGRCREHGETGLAYLSLTAPRLIMQDYWTPLMTAAQNESEHSVALAKVLVGAGAEVNAADDVSASGCNRVGFHDCAQATSCSTVWSCNVLWGASMVERRFIEGVKGCEEVSA